MIPSMTQLLESTASKEAEKLNLDYMKFGRWGKNGVVTHKTDDNGRLIPVKKADAPAAKPAAGKPQAPVAGKPQPAPQRPQAIKVGNIDIGPDKKSVSIKGRPLKLSNTEYKLLKMLATQKGQITTRSDLLQQVWDAAPDIVTRTVDMYVSRLKRKLVQSGANIQSVRGMGYRMHDLPMGESLTEGPSMTELTPEIQAKLLERAKKNIRWYKKLESVLTTMDDSDAKKVKVEKVCNVLKIQALLIIKSLKELDEPNEDDGELETNSEPIETLRRSPTRNNMPGQTPVGGGAGLGGI
jgi:DNA-binding winged helix-turn-helix (wHTH) protein